MRQLVLGLILAAGVSGTAFAMNACGGEFSSTALQALPTPAVVGLDLSDSSPTNTTLAEAFTRGMGVAGAQVAGAQPATVKLRLTWRILNQGGPTGQGSGGNALVPMQGGSADTGASLWSGNSQTFLQGGIDRAMPDMPRYDAFAPAPATQSGLLIFRAEARGAGGEPIYWIGSVQCTLNAADSQQLAYQLGQLVGGALGQRRDRVAM
jgi:hypothetical protein